MLWRDTPRAVTLVTAPTEEPMTFEDAKTFLRPANDDDEARIMRLVKAGRRKVEHDTGRQLLTQTWDLKFDAFPSDAIRPPFCPLQSVTSITTISAAGVSSVLAATNYQVDIASEPPRILLSDTGSWPSDLRDTHAITIRLVAGYASRAVVPEELILALQQIVVAGYRYIDGLAPAVPPSWLAGYDALIAPYRLWGAV